MEIGAYTKQTLFEIGIETTEDKFESAFIGIRRKILQQYFVLCDPIIFQLLR
jgi:hypothetical protein